jgi:predicted RNase H-like HicB family nuclease
MIRRVTIYSGEDGYWVVECPSLPGCVSQGKTKEEALINIKEAIQGYILALEEDGLPVALENVCDRSQKPGFSKYLDLW